MAHYNQKQNRNNSVFPFEAIISKIRFKTLTLILPNICLPSDLEGMPLSLLEAMSYGNCCLVSDIPECTEVVDDKAVLFRKSDISDLRQKLSSLIDNPDNAMQIKKQAADYICKKYDWEEVVEKTVSLYR